MLLNTTSTSVALVLPTGHQYAISIQSISPLGGPGPISISTYFYTGSTYSYFIVSCYVTLRNFTVAPDPVTVTDFQVIERPYASTVVNVRI